MTLFSCSVCSQWPFIGDELASFQPMDMDPSGLSHRACRASFLSSSVVPFTPFGSSLFEKGGQLGWRSNNYRLTVQCSWVDGWNIGVNGDKVNGMTVRKNRSLQVYKVLDKLPRSIYGTWHVSSFSWFLSRIEASLRLPCTFPIKTTPFPSHFSTFRKKHIVRALPSSLSEIRPFNSCIIWSHSFTLFLGK